MTSFLTYLLFQNAESEAYWEKLAQESDPSKEQKDVLNYTVIIPQIKSKILAFKAQVMRYIFLLCMYLHFPGRVVH